jgi:hypothetical protein
VHRPRKDAIGSLVRRGGGVAAALFRDQEIEGDGCSPGAFQRINKRGEALARPRPLPESLERFVVDFDDSDGLVERIRAWAPALVLIEELILDSGRVRRGQSAERKHR